MAAGFAVATGRLALCHFWFHNMKSGKTKGNRQTISDNVESMWVKFYERSNAISGHPFIS
jgi:hypothetical protein